MISITLPISEVADHTMVRKPTGQVTFEVSRGLKIYVKDGSGPCQEIKPAEGSVFMLGPNNNQIEQVTGDRLVALDFYSLQDLREWLDEQEEE